MLTRKMPICIFFFFNDTATTEIYTLSLHDALPISGLPAPARAARRSSRHQAAESEADRTRADHPARSEEHTSELQSLAYLVCRLLLEKKKKNRMTFTNIKHAQIEKIVHNIYLCRST